MARRRQQGEGSLFRRSRDSRWVARADLGYRDGKRDRREFTGATSREAREKRDAFLALRRDGFMPQRGRPETVATWMAHWLTNVAARKVEATTFERSYRQKTQDLIIPYLGHIRLAELTEDDVESWHGSLLRRTSARHRPLSASTITTAHRILSSACNEAVRRGRMPRNPCRLVPPPQIRRPEMSPPTAAQARVLLAACASWPTGARWVLALATGLRQGEVLGLRWLDVDLEERSLSVRQAMARVGHEWAPKAPKSERSKRTVKLPAVAVEALRAHRKAQRAEQLAAEQWEDNGLVFTRKANHRNGQTGGLPIHAKADHNDWCALLDAAGLPRFRVHDLRHATATALRERGTDLRMVADVLGHQDPAFTARVYQHAVPSMHQQAADDMDAWLRGES